MLSRLAGTLSWIQDRMRAIRPACVGSFAWQIWRRLRYAIFNDSNNDRNNKRINENECHASSERCIFLKLLTKPEFHEFVDIWMLHNSSKSKTSIFIINRCRMIVTYFFSLFGWNDQPFFCFFMTFYVPANTTWIMAQISVAYILILALSIHNISHLTFDTTALKVCTPEMHPPINQSQ